MSRFKQQYGSMTIFELREEMTALQAELESRDLTKRTAPPEALRTDDLKKAIGAILLKVVQGDHGYETPDGFRRWGRIQADINAEIDKTFAVSPQRRIDLRKLYSESRLALFGMFDDCDEERWQILREMERRLHNG